MNVDRIPELLAQIALADPRVRRTDPTERRAQIHMWAGILKDVPYEFAIEAATQHYAGSQWAIVPGDIATRWQALVRDRMRSDVGTFEPADHPWLDPDDVGGYLAALRGQRQRVALGQAPPSPVRALTSGPAAAEVEARLREMGGYTPPSVAQALAPVRPRRTERETAAEQSADPLSVTCPYEACRAPRLRPCRNGKHNRRTSHPSRIDAARARTEATS